MNVLASLLWGLLFGVANIRCIRYTYPMDIKIMYHRALSLDSTINYGGGDMDDWALRFEDEFQKSKMSSQVDKERAKLALEQEITRLVYDFTQQTGAKIGYGSITYGDVDGKTGYSTRLEIGI